MRRELSNVRSVSKSRQGELVLWLARDEVMVIKTHEDVSAIFLLTIREAALTFSSSLAWNLSRTTPGFTPLNSRNLWLSAAGTYWI